MKEPWRDGAKNIFTSEVCTLDYQSNYNLNRMQSWGVGNKGLLVSHLQKLKSLRIEDTQKRFLFQKAQVFFIIIHFLENEQMRSLRSKLRYIYLASFSF